ncbi:MAG: alpha/beta hydrolase [Anaerolineae bacterium]|jgi:pimeloyl-ACP methyl ester carboxylesterase
MPYCQVNDIELYYEVTGQGEPILFIHGLGSSARDWELQADHFAADYQVIVADVRGHGQSAKPPGPYSIPLFASDMAGLIKSLDLAPVHVIGISMGGMIGLELAADAPELVRSLVAANCGTDMVLKTWKLRWQLYQRWLIIHLLGMKRMSQVLSRRLFPKDDQAELRQALVERWSKNDPRAYWQTLKGFAGWSVTERLAEIVCPVLVIAADADYTPVEMKAAYARQLPRGELVVIPDSRHATPVERPGAFNQAVRTFLGAQQ